MYDHLPVCFTLSRFFFLMVYNDLSLYSNWTHLPIVNNKSDTLKTHYIVKLKLYEYFNTIIAILYVYITYLYDYTLNW